MFVNRTYILHEICELVTGKKGYSSFVFAASFFSFLWAVTLSLRDLQPDAFFFLDEMKMLDQFSDMIQVNRSWDFVHKKIYTTRGIEILHTNLYSIVYSSELFLAKPCFVDINRQSWKISRSSKSALLQGIGGLKPGVTRLWLSHWIRYKKICRHGFPFLVTVQRAVVSFLFLNFSLAVCKQVWF